MELKTISEQDASKNSRVKQHGLYKNPLLLTFIGFIFGGMLTLSATNGFLHFGYLAMGSTIVFALIGIHVLGSQQTKRN
ncbi:hypothetical protein GCM10011414_02760 [Croceivirga lutea]|uniref:hypothetical protein n=1 Tax=Croceivirga lutea TaxID=1775167 RepID=UPI001639CA51|nr:hypothetical protein [Croceivirga lutea]GGG36843.1 hypothetical protein GCM10011414_02760 [Croceivirga lutea]